MAKNAVSLALPPSRGRCGRLLQAHGSRRERTLSTFKAHRHELVYAKIAEHQGRIVKPTGDGLLVEFPSVLNAGACAVEIQHKMHERNAEVPSDRPIEFRIGIKAADPALRSKCSYPSCSAIPCDQPRKLATSYAMSNSAPPCLRYLERAIGLSTLLEP